MEKILLIGEPLIRITPLDYQMIGNSVTNRMYYGGAEINVACNLQGFGINTKLLTALPDNTIGDSFYQFLTAKGIDATAIQRIGERIGLYYMEEGFGCRQAQVYYDRQNTSLTKLDFNQVDVKDLLADVKHVHFSGITISLGEEIRNWLHIILTEAKKQHIPISIDLNWRSTLMALPEAKIHFSNFAKYADYCFGIEPILSDSNDFQLFNRYQASLHDIEERMRVLCEMYAFKQIFHTLRIQDEQCRNSYQAFGYDAKLKTFKASTQMKTAILQRVGSGDAFVSGALYQLNHEQSLQVILDFAVASATLKCTIEGDNMAQSPEQVLALMKQQRDILR